MLGRIAFIAGVAVLAGVAGANIAVTQIAQAKHLAEIRAYCASGAPLNIRLEGEREIAACTGSDGE